MGTDYNIGVLNVGIKKAVALVSEHHTLEEVVEYIADPSRTKYKKTVENDGNIDTGFCITQ